MAQWLIHLPANAGTRDTDPWSGRTLQAEEQRSLSASTTQVNTATSSGALQPREPCPLHLGESLQGRPAQPEIDE